VPYYGRFQLSFSRPGINTFTVLIIGDNPCACLSRERVSRYADYFADILGIERVELPSVGIVEVIPISVQTDKECGTPTYDCASAAHTHRLYFLSVGIIDINPMFRLFNVGYRLFLGINLNRKEQYTNESHQSFHTLSPFFTMVGLRLAAEAHFAG